jgi:hypothetical protein
MGHGVGETGGSCLLETFGKADPYSAQQAVGGDVETANGVQLESLTAKVL